MERRIFMVKKRKRWYVRIRQVMLLFALVFLCSAPLMISVKAEENSSQTATKTDVTTEYESKSGRKVVEKDNGKYVYKDTGGEVSRTLVRMNGKWYYFYGGVINREVGSASVDGVIYAIKNGVAYTGSRNIYGLTLSYTDGILTHINGTSVKNMVFTGKSGEKIVLKNNMFVYKNNGKGISGDLIKIDKRWYFAVGGTVSIVTNTNYIFPVGYLYLNKEFYYIKNGVAYTGSRTLGGITSYFVDGRVVKSYNSKSGKAVIKSNGKYVYGSSCKTVTNDLVRIGKKLYYIENGTIKKTNLKTVKVSGKYYYVKNGVAYTGNKTEKGVKYYYEEGVKKIFNGKSGKKVVKKNDKYTYVTTKKVVKSDLVRIGSKLYYIKNGKPQKKKTGTVKIGKSGYYIEKGVAFTGTKRTYHGKTQDDMTSATCSYIDGRKITAMTSTSGKKIVLKNVGGDTKYVYKSTNKPVWDDLVKIGKKVYYMHNYRLMTDYTSPALNNHGGVKTTSINGKSYYIIKGVAHHDHSWNCEHNDKCMYYCNVCDACVDDIDEHDAQTGCPKSFGYLHVYVSTTWTCDTCGKHITVDNKDCFPDG